MAPPSIALTLFGCESVKLNKAVAASFLPRIVPSVNKLINGGIPFEAPINVLFSSIIDKLNNAAAEFSLAPMVPFWRISIIAGIGFSFDTCFLILSSIERFSKAVTACSWILESG